MTRSRPVVLAALLLGLLSALMGWSDRAWAQLRPTTAEIKTLAGQVEIQRKGETQWLPAAVGMKLAEGDNIRAHAGASAVLDLPDGSTIFVAENTRVVVAKLEVDAQAKSRQALFHVVVGKVRAVVSQASMTLVRARQSNFSISTPTAVAAARGTIFEVVYDATSNVMRVAVLVTDPQRSAGIVACFSLFDRTSRVLVREGLASVAIGTGGCGAPVPISTLPDASLVGTLQNPNPPGPSFDGPVVVPSIPTDVVTPVVFGPDPPLSPLSPSTIGRDIAAPNSPTQTPSSVPPNQ